MDLAADAVLLMVQARLLGQGEMTAVTKGIAAFMHADDAVFAMEIGGLPRRDAALAQIALDAEILVGKAMVHFDATRMGILPRGGRGACRAQYHKARTHRRNEDLLSDTHDELPFSNPAECPALAWSTLAAAL